MGGLGSGTWYRWDKRRTLEECRRLDVRRLHRKGLLAEAGATYSWEWKESQTGERIASIGLYVEEWHVRLFYRHQQGGGDWQEVKQVVPVTWTPCNYGGRRPWFLCPGFGCGRRVAILYAGGKQFLCRHCYRLPYASTLETREDRLYRRANKIRLSLGGEAGALNLFPPKPKGMHHATYERLRQEAQLAERLGLFTAARRFGLSPEELLPW